MDFGGFWWILAGFSWVLNGFRWILVDFEWILVDFEWILLDFESILVYFGGFWMDVGGFWMDFHGFWLILNGFCCILVDFEWILGGFWWILVDSKGLHPPPCRLVKSTWRYDNRISSLIGGGYPPHPLGFSVAQEGKLQKWIFCGADVPFFQVAGAHFGVYPVHHLSRGCPLRIKA